MKVSEEDHARRHYLRRYFDDDCNNPLLYQRVVNAAKTGLAGAAETIVKAAVHHYEGYLIGRPSLAVCVYPENRKKHILGGGDAAVRKGAVKSVVGSQ